MKRSIVEWGVKAISHSQLIMKWWGEIDHFEEEVAHSLGINFSSFGNEGQFCYTQSSPPHWEFLSSDCSNLNLMRWWILLIVSFVSINSDKMTVWWTKIIKWTWEIILIKMKISARWHRCSKIFKTNLKTHISPLLNHPQGCQGCQKNRKDFRYLT